MPTKHLGARWELLVAVHGQNVDLDNHRLGFATESVPGWTVGHFYGNSYVIWRRNSDRDGFL